MKATGKKRNKHRKIVLITSTKLNGIEKLISKALTDDDTCHEQFKLFSNEAVNYLRLKENIRIKTSEKCNIE